MGAVAVISLEFRFYRTPENYYYTDSVFGAEFWERYLTKFSKLLIVARVQDIDCADDDWNRVDSERVSFLPMPYYIGPRQMLLKLPRLNSELARVACLRAHFILRVPSFIGILLYRKLLQKKKSFSLEVVGDPFDVFTPANFSGKMVYFYQWLFSKELKRKCLKASAVSYVTKATLQKSYPVSKGVGTTNYSSVELPDFFFADINRLERNTTPVSLLFIGSLSQRYKGLHILLEALAKIPRDRCDWSLNILGDGCYRKEYEALAGQLDLMPHVKFHGYQSSREAIYEYYCAADIFVLPSLTEGLPRVVIEAMATGLPVIASSVGGVPELLEDCALVEPGNVEALREKLVEYISSPNLMARQSKVNRQEAENYNAVILQQRREAFFQHIIDQATE